MSPTHDDPRRALAALLPDLRAFARFLARDRALADDLVQDALVRALGALAQYQSGTSLKAWVFTILRNAYYEQGRRRRREVALDDAPADPQASTHAAPDDGSRAEVRDLERVLWQLPPLLREALTLVGAQELSYEEAAAICRVPVGTMKARVSRARTALSRAMHGPTPGGAPASRFRDPSDDRGHATRPPSRPFAPQTPDDEDTLHDPDLPYSSRRHPP